MKKEACNFVHGFNSHIEDAIYRFAQSGMITEQEWASRRFCSPGRRNLFPRDIGVGVCDRPHIVRCVRERSRARTKLPAFCA
jgi:hypothetical protein